MTTPDPADVHTGTDRVELTKDERVSIGTAMRGWDTRTEGVIAAVESIIAARLEGYSYWSMVQTNEALHAELAAANARCAELEHLEHERKGFAESWAKQVAKADALQETLDRVTAGPALYLIRNSKTGEWFMGSVGGDDGIWAKNIAMSVVYSSQTGPRSGLPEGGEWVEFRAALTPEGKE